MTKRLVITEKHVRNVLKPLAVFFLVLIAVRFASVFLFLERLGLPGWLAISVSALVGVSLLAAICVFARRYLFRYWN